MVVRIGMRAARAAALLAMAAGGCTQDRHELGSFVLPSGDIERGKAAFVDLGCRQCHSVAGVELPDYQLPMRFHIELGGEVLKVRSYGELLTAVVNPDHELAAQFTRTIEAGNERPAQSPMPDFTGTMTVAQLIDIVEFLHSRYTLLIPEYTGFAYGP